MKQILALPIFFLSLLSFNLCVASGTYTFYKCGEYRLTIVRGDYNYEPANFERLDKVVNKAYVEVEFDLQKDRRNNVISVIVEKSKSGPIQCKITGSGYNGGAG